MVWLALLCVMPKTVLDKIISAIDTLADPLGASRPAIAKCVKETHGELSAALLKKALAQGVTKGKLIQQGQRFSIPGVIIAPAEEVMVQKTVIKPGDSSQCAAEGDEVDVAYKGTLDSDGSQFDRAAHFKFTLGAGDVIKGWDRGVLGKNAPPSVKRWLACHELLHRMCAPQSQGCVSESEQDLLCRPSWDTASEAPVLRFQGIRR